jgi:NADPH:quinone reductase-like Zn-dependent oxidoreductase
MTRRYKILSLILAVPLLLVGVLLLVLSHNSSCSGEVASNSAVPLMQAAVYRCYGSPQVVKIEKVIRPNARPGRLVVRVVAASVNPLDWHYLEGEPFFMRAMSGVGRPTDIRLGVDFAGVVEAVGAHVTRFRVGDEVFGGAAGAFAEYVDVREGGSIARKPANVTFAEAAAVPIAGVTALQALRDAGQLQSGQHVLVNGASGGVGTFAVQIAKALGAQVTGVCSTRNLEMVRSIGADRVIDYTHEDFTVLGDRYDLIIDNVGNHSQSEYRRVLGPRGRVVSVGGINCGVCFGPLAAWLGDYVANRLVTQKRVGLLASLEGRDLQALGTWMEQGRVKSVIDRTYSLGEISNALAYLEQGHARGKVVIQIPAEGGEGAAAENLAHRRF